MSASLTSLSGVLPLMRQVRQRGGLTLLTAERDLDASPLPILKEWLLFALREEDAADIEPASPPCFAHELRLEPGPATYRLDWPVVAMGSEKHLGYAVQWFALATTLVLLYLYFGWHHNKEKRHGHRHSTGSA